MGMTPEYKANKDKGDKFEQFVIEAWPKRYSGRTLTLIEGKKKQLRGETEQCIEIKFDDKIYKYCRSGRLYIETAEKSNPDNPKYVQSGIYRKDNTTIYLIGDCTIWFLFSKQKLQWLDKLDPPFLYRPKPTPTSKGFCIPIRNAKILCLDYQKF